MMRALATGVLSAALLATPTVLARPPGAWVGPHGGVHIKGGPPGPRGNMVVGQKGGVRIKGGPPGRRGDVFVGPQGGVHVPGGPPGPRGDVFVGPRGRGARVRMAPPALRVDVRPLAPTPRHLWAAGYWGWVGGRHAWTPGRWIDRRPGHVWVDARWANEGSEWVFYDGAYEPGEDPAAAPIVAQGAMVPPPPPAAGEYYAEVAPPQPQIEVVPVARAGYAWIPGYWRFAGGRHVWVAGRHEVARAGFLWAPAQWVQQGPRWRFVPGRWRQ